MNRYFAISYIGWLRGECYNGFSTIIVDDGYPNKKQLIKQLTNESGETFENIIFLHAPVELNEEDYLDWIR